METFRGYSYYCSLTVSTRGGDLMKILRNKIPLGILSLCVTAGLPSVALTEEMPARGPIPFKYFDRDNNGFVSEEEFNLTRGERMAQRSAEGRRMRNAGNAPAFSSFDSDNDGKLTPEELMAGHSLRWQQRQSQGMGKQIGMRRSEKVLTFSDVDQDGNGRISTAEFREARSRMMNERVQQGLALENAGYAATFTDIDVNENGVIDPGEFRAHQLQH